MFSHITTFHCSDFSWPSPSCSVWSNSLYLDSRQMQLYSFISSHRTNTIKCQSLINALVVEFLSNRPHCVIVVCVRALFLGAVTRSFLELRRVTLRGRVIYYKYYKWCRDLRADELPTLSTVDFLLAPKWLQMPPVAAQPRSFEGQGRDGVDSPVQSLIRERVDPVWGGGQRVSCRVIPPLSFAHRHLVTAQLLRPEERRVKWCNRDARLGPGRQREGRRDKKASLKIEI